MDLPRHLRTFVRDESGPTGVEYGVMLALIACVALVAVKALGATINAMFVDLTTYLSGLVPAAGFG
ncbi:MAG: Flp family type IVb pilin [Phycisphaerales bacterium]|nr:MAG: Flp family type IVb pilin [Phycisphaerales bacterium]